MRPEQRAASAAGIASAGRQNAAFHESFWFCDVRHAACNLQGSPLQEIPRMQINGIARQLLAPLQFDATTSSAASLAATKAASPPAADSDAGSLGPGFHEILSRYDVTNITPREFSDLVQELHDSGEINDDEFRQLSRMRLELEQAGVGADDPIDLIDFFEDKLRDQTDDLGAPQDPTAPPPETAGKDPAITAETHRQLEWVRKFALVHAAGADGVDVGA